MGKEAPSNGRSSRQPQPRKLTVSGHVLETRSNTGSTSAGNGANKTPTRSTNVNPKGGNWWDDIHPGDDRASDRMAMSAGLHRLAQDLYDPRAGNTKAPATRTPATKTPATAKKASKTTTRSR